MIETQDKEKENKEEVKIVKEHKAGKTEEKTKNQEGRLANRD